MSTPTAIEIVRDCHAWRRGEGKYAGDGFIPPVNIMPPYWMCQESDALASVLADAERFAALERAFSRHNDEGMITVMRWKGQRIWHYTKEPDIDGLTIAELADRLREETQ